jgi:16S rRNA (uracil1498-N3)-methyltransferase
MSGPLLFAPRDDWSDDEVRLPPEESRHAARVLRVVPPDPITVTDGCGTVARCAAARMEGDRIVARVHDRRREPRPTPEIVVYQGAAKGAKLDGAVERLAELGVAELWVYDSERSVVDWDESKLQKRLQRWRAIARSTAKQSRNPFVLTPRGGLSWNQLVARVATEGFVIALWEDAELPLRQAVSKPVDRVALVVGPEGGLSRDEGTALAKAGAQLVTLGPRILRTENAAVAAATVLLWNYRVFG